MPDHDTTENPIEETLHVLRNPGVLGIGLGSLLSDAGHEMATAALPGFLNSIGAPAAALGAIEGVADAALSASKVAGGVIADRPGIERKTVKGHNISWEAGYVFARHLEYKSGTPSLNPGETVLLRASTVY